MEVLAKIIVLFILFVWIPYMCFCVLRFVWCILNPFPFLRSLLPKPKAVEKPTSAPKKLVTTTCSINDALATLGVSREILKSYIASGAIRTYKEGDSLILNVEDVVKVSKKPGKRVFPVLDGYRDEHKINHPVVFDA